MMSHSANNLQDLMTIIDNNKGHIPDYDYLQICQLVQKIYDDKNREPDYDILTEYTSGHYLKISVNTTMLIINIVYVSLIFYYHLILFFIT